MVLAAAPLWSVSASEARFALRLNVPVVCAITDVQFDVLRPAEVVIDANCNAERFALQLGGNIGNLPIQRAQSSGGSVAAGPDTAVVTARRPGMNRIVLQFDQNLRSVNGASFSIQPA